MPLAARLYDNVPRVTENRIVSEKRPYGALEHKAVLVLAVMAMHGGREGTRLHRMLHERETTPSVQPIKKKLRPREP
jgi:hypothetical protein